MSDVVDTERLLHTSRVVLEPLLPTHAAALFAGLSDARLYQYHAGRPQSLEALELRFTQLATRRSPDNSEVWLNWAIRRHDGVYVGWIQATVANDVAIVGYDIFPDHWRNGYATGACRAVIEVLKSEYHVSLVRAVVDVENIASIGLLKSLGFVKVWTGKSGDMPGRIDHLYEKRMRA